MYVVSLLIQMHGKVITHDLDPETASAFDNVRLLCQAGGFQDYASSLMQEITLPSALRNTFTDDTLTTTYDAMMRHSTGPLVNNITYDKSLYAGSNFFESGLQGIYVLSVHRDGERVYPRTKREKFLNLLYLNDLERFANLFDTTFITDQFIESSIDFPSQKLYIDEENAVKRDNRIQEDEKNRRIKDIRLQFYNYLQKWTYTLSLDNTKIQTIKLSEMVKLVKRLIGQDCFLNILDYSCNSASAYIPEEQKTLKQYAFPDEDDIEMVNPPKTNLGGNHKRTYRRKKPTTSKKYKKKGVRKSSKKRV
jgi:hypothetical protein